MTRNITKPNSQLLAALPWEIEIVEQMELLESMSLSHRDLDFITMP